MFHLTTALDAASAVPLYEQLYQSLAAEMRAGAIPAGTRMPGKRRLAAELCQHSGWRVSDLSGGGLSGAKGAQRLLCTGISGSASPAGTCSGHSGKAHGAGSACRGGRTALSAGPV